MDAEAYADMLPWLVFLVIDRRGGLSVAWAASCATVCSAGLLAWSYRRGRRAPLPWVALVVFALCVVAALVVPVWDSAVGVTRSMVVLAVSVSAFASLWRTPISEAYTTPLVTPSVAERPRFRQVNVEMTAALGAGSLLVAVFGGVGSLVRGTVAFTFMDWVVPLVTAVVTLLWATRRWELFRLHVDARAPRHDAQAPHAAQALHLGPRASFYERPELFDHLDWTLDAQAHAPGAVIRTLPARRAQRLGRRTPRYR